MPNKNVTFLKMLLDELDNLEEKTNLQLDETNKRHDKGEITNYVFLENRATEERQILRIEHLKEIISKINPLDYNTLDDIINNVLHLVQEEIKNENLSEYSMEVIRKKIEKIKNYIEN